MKISIKVFVAPKAGNTEAEYEDSCYPTRDKSIRAPSLRFAVADGASESLLCGPWAKILTRTFCRSRIRIFNFKAYCKRAIFNWEKWKGSYLEERAKKNKPIQWYEEPGLAAGAFSTMLGLVIRESKKRSWEAFAVGDSCLFQVREKELLIRFPVGSSCDFGNFPSLLSSLHKRNADIDKRLLAIGGRWRSGDRFYLATDALAQWFMKEFEQGCEPWTIVDELASQESNQAFEDWMSDLRSKKLIRNDDVTLLRINLG